MNQMTNKVRITWVDSNGIYPESLKEMAVDSEFNFSFSSSVEAMTDSQLAADMCVVYIDTTVRPIENLLSAASRVGAKPIIIARVARQSFE